MEILNEGIKITLTTLMLILGHLTDGLREYEAGNFEKALPHFEKIIDDYQENDYTDDALFWAGQALQNLGKKSAAGKQYAALLKRFPKSEYAKRSIKERSKMGLTELIINDNPIKNSNQLQIIRDNEEKLLQLEQELAVLRTQYTDKHPTMIRLRQKITKLTAEMKQRGLIYRRIKITEEITQLVNEREELLLRYTKQHPAVQAVNEKIDNLKQALDYETDLMVKYANKNLAVSKLFNNVAIGVFKSMISDEPTKMKKMADALGTDVDNLPSALATNLIGMFDESFELSENEIDAILSQKFDDKKNMAAVKNAVKSFEKLSAELPAFTVVLINKIGTGQIKSGIELEFAARVLNGHLKQIRTRIAGHGK